MSTIEIWHLYSVRKLSAADIADRAGLSLTAVKDRVRSYRLRNGLALPKRRQYELTARARATSAGMHCTACGNDGHTVKTCPRRGVIPGTLLGNPRCERCGLLKPCVPCVPTASEMASARADRTAYPEPFSS